MFLYGLDQNYTDILIIYFMSLPSSKPTEHPNQHPTDTSPPSTPRKRPKYAQEEGASRRKVKSITKLIEKQSTNYIYSLMVLLWACFLVGAILMSFQAKRQQVENAAIREIDKCAMDYQTNRCDAPVKGVVHFCSQRQACMNEDPRQLAERRMSYMGILGEMGRELMNGAGMAGVLVGVLLIWLSVRQKGLTRTITSVQYYQN